MKANRATRRATILGGPLLARALREALQEELAQLPAPPKIPAAILAEIEQAVQTHLRISGEGSVPTPLQEMAPQPPASARSGNSTRPFHAHLRSLAALLVSGRGRRAEGTAPASCGGVHQAQGTSAQATAGVAQLSTLNPQRGEAR